MFLVVVATEGHGNVELACGCSVADARAGPWAFDHKCHTIRSINVRNLYKRDFVSWSPLTLASISTVRWFRQFNVVKSTVSQHNIKHIEPLTS